MPEAVIIDTIRTPIGNLGGALSSIRPDDLAALVVKAIVERNDLDPRLVEEVYLGCANQAGEDNRNVARMASLLAGLPVSVPGVTFNRLCASGLTAVNTAARSIRAGDGKAFIAGGVESMSRAPFAMPKPTRPVGNQTAYDTTLGWRFVNPKMESSYGADPLGITAENIAGPSPRRTQASLPKRSCPSASPNAKANRASSTRTNALAAIPALKLWPACVRLSNRMAA
jgi:acetyl-CoA acetyltransferase